MNRGASIVWFCLWASLPALHGQTSTPPIVPAQANEDTAALVPSSPVATPSSVAAPDDQDDKAPVTNPTPKPPVDPKTGLPLTPAEQREKEIDKYDPMKRDQDILPGSVPVTPGKTDAAGTDPNATDPRYARPDDKGKNGVPRAGGPASPSDAISPENQYSGPAVLSRSYTLARPMVPQQVKWRATFSFNESKSYGQAPAAANGATSYTSANTDSRTIGWSLSGRHIWKKDQLGLSYSGGYSDYGSGGVSGLNHSLNLDYAHILSRRLVLHVVESGQEFSQNYALENPALAPGSSIANINLATSPGVQLLNSSTRQLSSQLSLTFHQSTRLSYNMSTATFVIGRSEGVGMTGRQASGDVNYRWTRKATVGAYYSFTDYVYPHNIATSDSNAVGLIYSYAFNSRMQLQTRIGATRIETLAYQSVPLPPLLAAILGQGSALVNAYFVLRTSDISAAFLKDFRGSRKITLAYAHGQTPGNGVLLTSVQESISAGFSTSLLRKRLPLNTGVAYSTLRAVGQATLGSYKSESVNLSTSRSLGASASGTLQVDYLRYDLSNSPILQHTLRVSLGLSWSAPERWLRF